MATEQQAETYQYITDAGHGWLRVPMREISALGIAPQISQYSYIYGQYAYLEEDQDMTIFLDAKGLKISDPSINCPEQVDGESAVRNYPSFPVDTVGNIET